MDCEEAGGVTEGVGVDEHYKKKRVRSEEEQYKQKGGR